MSLPSTPPTGERVAGIPAPHHHAADPDPTVSQPTAVETADSEGGVSETEEKSSRRRVLPWEVATPSRRQRASIASDAPSLTLSRRSTTSTPAASTSAASPKASTPQQPWGVCSTNSQVRSRSMSEPSSANAHAPASTLPVPPAGGSAGRRHSQKNRRRAPDNSMPRDTASQPQQESSVFPVRQYDAPSPKCDHIHSLCRS